MNVLNVWSLVGEVGLIIVIPLIILLFIGLKIDSLLGTKPLFTFVSLPVAAIISVIVIRRKIRQLNQTEGSK